MSNKQLIIKTFKVVGSIILILFAGSIIISVFYKEEVVKYFIKDLNQYVATEIAAEKVDFSILKKFPTATVQFKNVYAKSTPNINARQFNNSDTLFYVQQLNLSFNLIDLLRKKYIIRNIEIKNADIHFFVDSKNEVNYIFWKTQKTNSNHSLSINLEKIKLKNCMFSYINVNKKCDIDVNINNAYATGNFASGQLNLNIESSFYLPKFKIAKDDYKILSDIRLKTRLFTDGNRISFHKGILNLNDLSFNIDGGFKTSPELSVDISINANKMNLISLLSSLPFENKTLLNDYKSEGIISFKSTINGLITNQELPKIEIDFNIHNGSITKSNTKISLNDIELKGNFTNGHEKKLISSKIEVDNISFTLNNRPVKGAFSVTNLINPFWSFTISGNTELNELQQFIHYEKIKEMNGLLSYNLKIEGSTNSITQLSKNELVKFDWKGNIQFKDVLFETNDDIGRIEKLTGEVELDENIKLNHVSFMKNTSDFIINGQVINFLAYIFLENETLGIEANIYSNNLDLTPWISFAENTNLTGTGYNKNSEDNGLLFPANINFTGNFFINRFTWHKFNAENGKGRLNYNNKKLVLNSVSFITSNGTVTGGGVIFQKNSGDFLVRAQTRLSELNIQQMFYSLNNFGQDVLVSENIDGNFSGNIDFSATYDKFLHVDENSIECNADIIITDGRLIDFTPLLCLSKFIKVEELRDVQFSTLKNQIFIKNKTINIPQMDIASSAIDIKAYGQHYFDNHYEYHVKLLLSDILAHKAKKNTSKLSEFGPIEDDGLGRTYIPLIITGKDEDFMVNYDFKAVKTNFKEKLREEKKELKTVLNKEFGKDSKGNENDFVTTDNPEETKKMHIQWEEETNENKNIKNDSIVKPKKDFNIEWEDGGADK